MVRDMLVELANDVPNYADSDRALLAARQIRRRRRTAGLAALLTAVAAVTGSVVWRPEPGIRVAPPDQNVAAGTGYPSSVPALRDPPPLPDRAVGPAALLYRASCAERPCATSVVLVVGDGTQYDLGRLGDLSVPSLSPDGRWLVAPFDAGTFTLRDLTSDSGQQPPLSERLAPVGGWEPMTWSPDSRWLLMWWPLGQDSYRYARVDLVDRQVVRYQPPSGTQVIAILPSGELVVEPTPWTNGTLPLSLRLVDPVTGAERALPPAGAGTALRPGQTVQNEGVHPALLSPDGSRLMATVWAGNRAVGLLELDLATGALLRRFDLPADGKWSAAAYTDRGVVLVRHDTWRQVFLLDPATGKVTQATSLPDPQAVLIRGGHTWF